jgi:hypothetical protein
VERCKATTDRLNCGCCDEVRFACTLNADHDGPHIDKTDYFGSETLTVTWGGPDGR